MKLEYYTSDVLTASRVREIIEGVKLLVTPVHEYDYRVYIRGELFEDVKTGDLVFLYGSWTELIHCGTKYLTMMVDGHETQCRIEKPFDVKVEYNARH